MAKVSQTTKPKAAAVLPKVATPVVPRVQQPDKYSPNLALTLPNQRQDVYSPNLALTLPTAASRTWGPGGYLPTTGLPILNIVGAPPPTTFQPGGTTPFQLNVTPTNQLQTTGGRGQNIVNMPTAPAQLSPGAWAAQENAGITTPPTPYSMFEPGVHGSRNAAGTRLGTNPYIQGLQGNWQEQVLAHAGAGKYTYSGGLWQMYNDRYSGNTLWENVASPLVQYTQTQQAALWGGGTGGGGTDGGGTSSGGTGGGGGGGGSYGYSNSPGLINWRIGF